MNFAFKLLRNQLFLKMFGYIQFLLFIKAVVTTHYKLCDHCRSTYLKYLNIIIMIIFLQFSSDLYLHKPARYSLAIRKESSFNVSRKLRRLQTSETFLKNIILKIIYCHKLYWTIRSLLESFLAMTRENDCSKLQHRFCRLSQVKLQKIY